jgi:hypothetical protein
MKLTPLPSQHKALGTPLWRYCMIGMCAHRAPLDLGLVVAEGVIQLAVVERPHLIQGRSTQTVNNLLDASMLTRIAYGDVLLMLTIPSQQVVQGIGNCQRAYLLTLGILPWLILAHHLKAWEHEGVKHQSPGLISEAVRPT